MFAGSVKIVRIMLIPSYAKIAFEMVITRDIEFREKQIVQDVVIVEIVASGAKKVIVRITKELKWIVWVQ